MLRTIAIFVLSLTLCWTTVGCGSPNSSQVSLNRGGNTSFTPTRLSDGKYPVQQATYDDVNGVYTLMVLNTPAGSPPVFRSQDLQMARLTDEQVAAGENTYLSIDDNQPVMYLTEDFRIEYVHNVTENRPNPQTGQQETVIVRQQSSFWAPFAGALAGQAIGSLLFRPQYYVPPVYQPGGVLTGYGGYGNSYSQAVKRYETRYQSPPPVVKNTRSFRTTGSLRKSPTANQATTRKASPNTNRSTGSGFGSSQLRTSSPSSAQKAKPRSSGFGSTNRSRSGFGSSRGGSRSFRRRR
ncbi:hypothetical protein [Moorena sp. SIO3H5]|uniref:hypothetical protein n=1 Tax=Moorena sp. SIO3H5 TaxID=2607834 RepID=UPI0013BE1DE6|nr:hypothetical protein [Moorena sp. SIO3H5]NEO68107.1 hypothetical protein [Moorena sp. SIO3H5]